MKLSEQWLREWINPRLDRHEVAERLTLAGLEVDAVDAVEIEFSSVVVGEILSVEVHPKAERLKVCRVYDGKSEHLVVCGAPNARAGLKAAFARVGAKVPGGRIQRTEIRGVMSRGMLCSAAELGLGEQAEGLLELDQASEPGIPLQKLFDKNDAVFEIGLTPNRGDCFSILGIARDLSALVRAKMRDAECVPVAPVNSDLIPVSLEAPAACPRYAGRVVSNISPDSRTPLWMSERLRRAGVRVIHPVVDVTNYVMLELGQPMHAFDLGALGSQVRVRRARPEERLLLLDGNEITLDEQTLVIADDNNAVALAGVMGGEHSAVSSQSTSIFLESAYFDPVELAGVARRYRMQTDASTRFERGVDPTRQERAIERATALILSICGGEPGPTTVLESTTHVPRRAAISFRPSRVNELLGTRISNDRIYRVLKSLQLEVERGASIWRVTPPPFRFDLTLEVDLVEEVARITGYDAIPSAAPSVVISLEDLSGAELTPEKTVREALVSRGYHEIVSYSFIAPETHENFSTKPSLALANPISSEMASMRPSLCPGLVEAARHNLNRQHKDLMLFEAGAVFGADYEHGQELRVAGLRCGSAVREQWGLSPRKVDFFDLKQDMTIAFQSFSGDLLEFRESAEEALRPGQRADVLCRGAVIGTIGSIHPRLLRIYDIELPLFVFELALPGRVRRKRCAYEPISRFPAVRRDLNIVVDQQVASAACLKVVRKAAGEILRDLQLFDVYEGQHIDSNKKSMTLGLIFQAVSSTLTIEQVDEAVASVLGALARETGAALRN